MVCLLQEIIFDNVALQPWLFAIGWGVDGKLVTYGTNQPWANMTPIIIFFAAANNITIAKNASQTGAAGIHGKTKQLCVPTIVSTFV